MPLITPRAASRLEPGHGEGAAPALSVVPRVDGDHVDLAEDGSPVAVDLRPARADETRAVGVVGQQEAVELDPVGLHAFAELLDGPRALLGVARKGPVVGVDPGRLVLTRHEGSGDEGPGGRHDIVGQRERDAHLEQVALGREAVRLGARVVGGTGLHGPQVDRRAGRRRSQRRGSMSSDATSPSLVAGSTTT